MKISIVIISLFFNLAAIAQNDAFFAKGNNLYNDGKFQDAITTYERILESEYHSAELYFNLGNAYYKLNRIAPSIYYYEKALQLSPKDEDILNNIAFARNMTVDAIEVIPEIGFSRFMKGTINALSYDMWGLVSILCVLLFVFLFLTYYFSYSTIRKRLSFLGSVITLSLALMALVFAFQKYEIDQNYNPAIVFVHESEIKSEPNLRSEISFLLHEGTKVEVLDRYNDTWVKIRLLDGKTGWIPSDDIREL